MKKKDYLVECLSKEEKKYLKLIIINTRNKYIRDNYEQINNKNIDLYDCINVEGESVLDVVVKKCEEEIKSAIEFEKVISNEKLYNIIKALSFNEKMVLFLLYKKGESINQISKEMHMDRTTIWRLKSRVLDKIMKKLLGGIENV